MSAYCLFNNIEILNPEGMALYREKVFAVVSKYQGEYVSVGGQVELKEGNLNLKFPVLIRFPNMQIANEWYNSSDYAELLALRKKSGIFEAVFFEGPLPQLK